MTPALLDRACAAGIRLWIDGDALLFDAPPSALDLLAELREHRADLREALEERAAIQSVEAEGEYHALFRMAGWSARDLRRALAIARREKPACDYTRALEAESLRRDPALVSPRAERTPKPCP